VRGGELDFAVFIVWVVAAIAMVAASPALANNALDSMECDVNGDGAIDYKDAAILQGAFGHEKGDPGWRCTAHSIWYLAYCKCDFNNDKVVNFADAMIFSKAWKWYNANYK
jgi:hypothetical protein